MRRYELDINGNHVTVAVLSFSATAAEIELDGTRYTVRVDDVVTDGEHPFPSATARSFTQPAPDPPLPARAPRPAGVGTDPGSVVAPIPGQILEILVREGDQVRKGQPLLKMEAMKMENLVNAPVPGTVAHIRCNPGDAVGQGQELMVIG